MQLTAVTLFGEGRNLPGVTLLRCNMGFLLDFCDHRSLIDRIGDLTLNINIGAAPTESRELYDLNLS